jgi:hypothetical protein
MCEIKVRVFFRLLNFKIVGFYYLFNLTALHVSVIRPSSGTHIFLRLILLTTDRS